MSEKKKDNRTRNFATVVYPESAPENWKDILSEHLVPAFISPLHNLDVNPTGEVKKEHYHVIIMFSGNKSVEQVCEIFNTIGGVGCEKVKSLRGYARYLCHLDNPEKYQYDTSDVKALCGADYFGTISLVVDKYIAIGEIIDYCAENHIYSFAELLLYARSNRMDWFRVLCDNGTVVVKEFLKSLQWSTRSAKSE